MGNLVVENGQSCALRIASARFPASLKTKKSMKNTILKGNVTISNPRFVMKASCYFVWLGNSLSKNAAEKRLPGNVRSGHADFAATGLQFDGIHDAP